MLDIQHEPARIRARFPSDITHVDTICNAVGHLFAEHWPFSSQFAPQLVLRELLNNAVRHGNRGNRDKSVECSVQITADSVLIEVADEGEGFAWQERFPPTDDGTAAIDGSGELSTSSYGMKILAHYASEVVFNASGNRVVVRMERNNGGGLSMSGVQRDGVRAIYSPAVNIVASEIDLLRTEFKQLLAEGVTDLVVDLSAVRMIDSMGLGVLISAHNSLKKLGGSFSVINASKELYDLFRSMRLTQHFSVTSV